MLPRAELDFPACISRYAIGFERLPAAASRQTRLNALGVDSLVAMELRNRLLHDWAVDVPVQMFIGGARGSEVVDHILGQLQVRQLIAAPSDEVEGEEREMWTL